MGTDLYRRDLNLGGWFSFNSNREDWVSFYGEKMANHFFGEDLLENNFGGFSTSQELLITNNINFQSLKGKRVLVCGAGPSLDDITSSDLQSYDYVFSCNHFYRNEILKKNKIDVCLIGDEVDLNDDQFNNYLEEFSPAVAFEHSGRRSLSEVIKFRNRYPKCFVYLTRYFSRLGYVPRALILASLANPSQLDYIGMDGFKEGHYKHCFEPGKPPPTFNESDKFKSQMKIFLNYLIYDIGYSNIKDLGAEHISNIYTEILKDIKNEKN